MARPAAMSVYDTFFGPKRFLVVLTIVTCLFVLTVAPVRAQSEVEDCGNPFKNGYGPFDYRTATQAQKDIVENNHFTPPVESLRSGITGPVGAELDYTLRAFPNHPRALMAMIRLGQRDRTIRPRGTHFTVRCYVERAVQFRPDDPNARQVRGIYLARQGRHQEAIADFAFAIERDPNNAGAHYNLGLAYFETKDYQAAMKEAEIAESLGFSLKGLKEKLKSVGRQLE